MLARVGGGGEGAGRPASRLGLEAVKARGYRVVIKLTFYLEAAMRARRGLRPVDGQEGRRGRREGGEKEGRKEGERGNDRGVKPLQSKEARNCARLSSL